jgi:hypothetical protein
LIAFRVVALNIQAREFTSPATEGREGARFLRGELTRARANAWLAHAIAKQYARGIFNSRAGIQREQASWENRARVIRASQADPEKRLLRRTLFHRGFSEPIRQRLQSAHLARAHTHIAASAMANRIQEPGK